MKRLVLGATVILGLLANACIMQPDASDRFREAIPQSGEVATHVPGGSSSATGARSAGLGIRDLGGVGQRAEFYDFTRDITDSVDFHSALILGAVWAVASTPPTQTVGSTAIWGPGSGNALDPVVWRFTATEVASSEFDYKLEGRPKGSTSDADFKVVLQGHGYAKAHPKHRQGWFEWDNDAQRALDPARVKDTGRAKVTYDLRATPSTLAVELRPTSSGAALDVTVSHEAGGAGSVTIKGKADFDKATAALEDVNVVSRWAPSGAGRADVAAAGGDLVAPAKVSECWSPAFARVYVSYASGASATAGTAAECAFADSKL